MITKIDNDNYYIHYYYIMKPIYTICIIGFMFLTTTVDSANNQYGGYGSYGGYGGYNDLNCTVSNWGPWGDCVNGIKFRTRTIVTPAQHGGTCPALSDIASCPIDCILSEWGPWSNCINFHRTRMRTIAQLPFNGGKPCQSLCETQICTGCGPDLIVFECILNQTQHNTTCILPGGALSVIIPNKRGYAKAQVRVNAKAVNYTH